MTTPADEPTPITPLLVEGALINAFPGIDIGKSEAIGRKKVFTVSFSEFALTITTPETSGMRGQTTLMFRRSIQPRVSTHRGGPSKPLLVMNEIKIFEWDQADALASEIQWARGYIMGIVMALSSAFEERLGSPRSSLLGKSTCQTDT